MRGYQPKVYADVHRVFGYTVTFDSKGNMLIRNPKNKPYSPTALEQKCVEAIIEMHKEYDLATSPVDAYTVSMNLSEDGHATVLRYGEPFAQVMGNKQHDPATTLTRANKMADTLNSQEPRISGEDASRILTDLLSKVKNH